MAHTHAHTGRSHVEPDDVHIGAIVKFVIALTVVTLVVHGFVWMLMGRITATMAAEEVILYPLAREQGERLPPEPRLQTQPRQDLADTRERERLQLEGYTWVDKSTGTVRLPIERAMKSVIDRGLPVRSAPPASGGAAATAETATPGQESGEKK